MPAGGSPPRQTTAPATDAHSHSPSSGVRGCVCVQRDPSQRKRGASSSRSRQIRFAPAPVQRNPEGEIATSGFGRSNAQIPCAHSGPSGAPQHTRKSSPTSAHAPLGSRAGEGKSVSTVTGNGAPRFAQPARAASATHAAASTAPSSCLRWPAVARRTSTPRRRPRGGSGAGASAMRHGVLTDVHDAGAER